MCDFYFCLTRLRVLSGGGNQLLYMHPPPATPATHSHRNKIIQLYTAYRIISCAFSPIWFHTYWFCVCSLRQRLRWSEKNCTKPSLSLSLPVFVCVVHFCVVAVFRFIYCGKSVECIVCVWALMHVQNENALNETELSIVGKVFNSTTIKPKYTIEKWYTTCKKTAAAAAATQPPMDWFPKRDDSFNESIV